ncbi:MAG: hypothetical protein KME54_28855 [Tolypothrix brevis GSE-NOS-MK-07-07A]|nr:hypothetical protein [Tolypothrix brevis GSE-NOS-MK-07-07A]
MDEKDNQDNDKNTYIYFLLNQLRSSFFGPNFIMINWAIKYIRNWREVQNLEPLPAQEEYAIATKLLQQKGYLLDNKINIGDTIYYLIDGEYKQKMELVVNEENLTPWEPHDKREFWCDRLGFFVRLTGDLDINGFYRVSKLGDASFRYYQAKGSELVLKEHAPINAPSTDLLRVNTATWAEIKAHICDKFISSYPWEKQLDKTASQVRAEMDTLAKSRHKGLAKIIEDERSSSHGNYEGIENFVLRMNITHESFPWKEFAQTLDFSH